MKNLKSLNIDAITKEAQIHVKGGAKAQATLPVLPSSPTLPTPSQGVFPTLPTLPTLP